MKALNEAYEGVAEFNDMMRKVTTAPNGASRAPGNTRAERREHERRERAAARQLKKRLAKAQR